MPELPEVETIRLALRQGAGGAPKLPGQRIEGVRLGWPRHVAAPSPAAFRNRIRGQTIRDVQRRGKYLVLPLTQETLLIHLMMSGDLGMLPAGAPPRPHDHTILTLDTGWELRFNDPRKFGKLLLLPRPEQLLGRLGPEPLSPQFTRQVLAERLSGRGRTLKPLLLDQAFLAGLGNIYADEALHRARLHPLRRSDSLRPEEVAALWRGIRQALRAGLRHNGASIDWVYRGGDFQNHFRAYGRTGEPCPVCGTHIQRLVVGQRSTHFCPHCQQEKPA
ncbi:MAG TPA: bifunctional DNA-formamidopyrimidine glycosylase/DNA-(apurinic or apyrimidinic site) lyase [Anaerolineales bacterium]